MDASLADWITGNACFVTTMVDRITPATTDEHRAAVASTLGVADAAPVPTEPFAEWVIQGEFPAGRPAWDAAGARIVGDVEPFERRKLTLLNGSHSLLAYAGSILGHETVADAVADARCLAWVNQWWDEACPQLPLPQVRLAAYRRALVERFRNPNIRHALAQIAADGSLKLPVRAVPTIRAELAAGRVPEGACRAIAAWALHLRGVGARVLDANASVVEALAAGTLDDTVAGVLGYLGLAGEPLVTATVRRLAGELSSMVV